MPYYVFKMSSPAGMSLVKNLELIKEFEVFKQARNFARDERARLGDGEDITIKIMFAENQLLAEEQLMEHRDKPIIMEHEK